MPHAIDPEELNDQAQLGRLLTRIENDPVAATDVLEGLPPSQAHVGHRIGVTGSPGVGKSTLLKALIERLRKDGLRVGVAAVDATSPFSGGALLGDRLRLSTLQADDGVFIRSLGSRGSLGGVAPGAAAIVRVLEAAGYDRIVIETVGVGQTGFDVIGLADTVVVLFSPEGGDGLQMLKAGILEVGDVFAVNKSDRPGAEQMLKEVQLGLELAPPTPEELLHHAGMFPARDASASVKESMDNDLWIYPVVRLTAKTGEGVDELYSAIDEHRRWLESLPSDHPRRQLRTTRELLFAVRADLNQLLQFELGALVATLAKDVGSGRLGLMDATARLRGELRDRLLRL